MLPREFNQRFGRPIPRLITGSGIGLGDVVVVAPNEDRYLLVVKCQAGQANYWWDSQIAVTAIIYDQLTAGDEIIVTHALHGGWPTLGIKFQGVVPGTSIWVIEGFMTPEPKPKPVGTNGKRVANTTSQLDTRGRRATKAIRP